MLAFKTLLFCVGSSERKNDPGNPKDFRGSCLRSQITALLLSQITALLLRTVLLLSQIAAVTAFADNSATASQITALLLRR